MRLEGIMRLPRRHISVIELDRRAGECSVRIASTTFQALQWSECCHDLVGLIVGGKMRIDVRFFDGIGCAHGIGSGFRCLECLCYRERNILAVVANRLIFEGWAAFFAYPRES